MDAHPDDVSTTDDLTLVGSARAGDRLAFGMLYLRHHAAAWRVACVASRFSTDAELAVIEGFTRVFSALPEISEEIEAGSVTFRPYLLACVRQSALDRAQSAGRAELSKSGPTTSTRPPAALAGLTLDGEVRLSGLEHHIARGALAALAERPRTALWLSDVEAMTPGEVAGILGGPPEEIAALAATARAELHTVQQTALDRQEVRAQCRFSAERLAAYEAGTLDPADGLVVRSHLADCPTCRMRQGELGNTPAALAAAVPAAPLLGGESQHHWLAAKADIQPAERLLPPILAAGGAVPRESLARRTATHLGTAAGAAAAPARRLPDSLRRAGRAAAGAWQGDSIDLTTRAPRPTSPAVGPPPPPEPSGSTGSPADQTTGPTTAAGSGASDADPTTPSGWTGSPGWSGSPVPSLPPGWTIPPGRAARNRRDGRTRRQPARRIATTTPLPQLARRVKRATMPALPAMALAVAWVLVMMALPRLMTPSTAPGPGGLALPAVQAYVPGFSPATDGNSSSASKRSTASAAPTAGRDPSRDPAGSTDSSALGEQPSFALVAAASGPAPASSSNRPGAGAGRPPVPVPSETPPVADLVTAAAATPPLTLIPTVVTAPSASDLDTPITPQVIDTGKAHKPKANNPKDRPDKAKPNKSEEATTDPKKVDKAPEAHPARRSQGPARGRPLPRLRIFTA